MEQCFPPEPLTVSSLILAGGQSRRMGRDKALIEVQGQPLIQRIYAIAQTLTPQVYIITAWGERYQSLLPEDCLIIPEIESKGPLAAFILGLQEITTQWCLLLACDLPNLTAEAIHQWKNYLSQTPQEAIALLPRHSKGWEPLCGFYRLRCLELGQQFIQQGGRSFQQWLAQHPVHPLPVEDPQVLFNCNTPLDLAQLGNNYFPPETSPILSIDSEQ